jgi:hypothetical protein
MGKEIDVKKYLTEGFEMFKANTNTLVVLTLGFIVISVIVNFIPFAGLIATGPLAGAYCFAIMDLNAGESFDIKRIADATAGKIVPLILASLVTLILTGAATVFLILPGILVSGWYLFTYFFIVDRDMDFWPAMEASREIGFSNQVGIFIFALALIVLNIVGMLALGIGVLVSLPVSICAVFKAYSDLVGLANDPRSSVGTSKALGDKPSVRVTPPPPPPAKK